MKFNQFALAAALALTGASASAGIIGAGSGNTAADNAEMLLLVWNPTTQTSFVQDLGLTLGTFRANGNMAGYSFSAAATSIYTGSTLATTIGTRWAVVGYDTYGDPIPDSEGNSQSLLTTVSKDAGFSSAAPGITGDKIANGTTGWGAWTAALNLVATHNGQTNGSSLSTKSDTTTYLFDSFNGIQDNFAGNFGYSSGNAVGTNSSFYRFSGSDVFDTTAPATTEQFGGQWSFNGTTVAYNVAAAPVPEPGTYGLFIAGLMAMGFVVRRRG
jgi:hypothetical protein